MKPEIHPKYKEVKVTCSCGSTFTTRSTLGRESLLLEVCASCHPFYTGTQKIVDTAGRVDRFRQKYGMGGNKKAEAKPVEKAPEAKVEAKAEAKAEPKKATAKKATTAKKTTKAAKDDKKAE